MNYRHKITLAVRAINKRLTSKEKTVILLAVADELKKNREKILTANRQDVAREHYDEAFADRLKLNEKRLQEMIEGIKQVAKLEDPVGKIIETRILANKIKLQKVAVPLGVILVIYEARPNVTAEAFSLSFKAGNGVVLKGGSAALETNKIVVQLIKAALKKFGLEDIVVFIDSDDREIVKGLLKLHDLITVVIPRGGKQLVEMVRRESLIPVLSHADGIDHIYVDKSADLFMAVKVIIDAKTNRPATCNAVDTVLLHKSMASKFLPVLGKALKEKNVAINNEYGKEFLGLRIAIKTVRDVHEAIEHIDQYGSHHTEGVVAADRRVIEEFVQGVDAAAVTVNCSTRLHDGGIFGMGAEMGIATGKLHARGPVGLNELTTYKWVAYGKGQIRG